MSDPRLPPYQVELPIFEGPLDLLLHLVKKHELDIFDIPIAFITEKYLEYLSLLRSLSLEVAGEYLLMAATLMYIKSRELLPTPDVEQAEELEDEVDPREELIRRLLEYQKYREAAETLAGRPLLGRQVWTRGSKVTAPAPEGEPPFGEVSVFRLVEALSRLCEKKKLALTHDVVIDRISIADRIGELCDLLAERHSMTFEDCFAGALGGESRIAIVTTFLALLEMARLRMIRVHQVDDFGSIFISQRVSDLESAAAAAVADLQERETPARADETDGSSEPPAAGSGVEPAAGEREPLPDASSDGGPTGS